MVRSPRPHTRSLLTFGSIRPLSPRLPTKLPPPPSPYRPHTTPPPTPALQRRHSRYPLSINIRPLPQHTKPRSRPKLDRLLNGHSIDHETRPLRHPDYPPTALHPTNTRAYLPQTLRRQTQHQPPTTNKPKSNTARCPSLRNAPPQPPPIHRLRLRLRLNILL